MPNYSHLTGTMCSGALSNAYYPSADRGASLVFVKAGVGIAGRAGGVVLHEFLGKKLTRNAPKSTPSSPVPPSPANSTPTRQPSASEIPNPPTRGFHFGSALPSLVVIDGRHPILAFTSKQSALATHKGSQCHGCFGSSRCRRLADPTSAGGC